MTSVTLADYAGREVKVSPDAATSMLASGNWTKTPEAPAPRTRRKSTDEK